MDHETPNKGMVMKQPAIRWQDALPCGNGILGALVYGHIRDEIIILNHDNLWLRHDKPKLSPIHQYVNEMRAMLLEGKYQEGWSFFEEKLKKNYSGKQNPAPYQPAFDIQLKTGVSSAFTNYWRSLDFKTGEAEVLWRESGIQYNRSLFVSRADKAVVLNIAASEAGAVNLECTLTAHDGESNAAMGSGKGINGVQLPFTYEVTAEHPFICFNGVQANGQPFGGVAKVVLSGGGINTESNKFVIQYADQVMLLVKIYVNEESHSAIARLKNELNEITGDYQVLLKRHVQIHQPLFNRMSLRLAEATPYTESNEEMLLSAYNGSVPLEMIQTMFDYGRYLIISSSCPGGMPANLQGLWNGDYYPAWESDYHNDENIQMNYWAALPGNLSETTLAYFDYYESMLQDFQYNAKNIYGCRGIFAPIAQTTHGILYGANIWTAWTAGAGWLAQLLYDYWLFTGDDDFLKERALPFLREVAQFYEDFLVMDQHGKYMFIPSLSPENQPLIEQPSLITVNATMDIAIAREVITNLCNAYNYLNIEDDQTRKWRDILLYLPEYTVNEDGAIKEWIHPGLKDNYRHRHLSHLYPLFPGLEITEESHPELYQAMRIAVEKRLVIGLTSQTSWSLAHMANIYARLCDGNRALECLELICRSCVGQNFFTYHNDWRSQGITMFWGHRIQPPFQIDANFGFTAAILEMLVFSMPGSLKLLPALPDAWISGKFTNILCRGGITVSATWNTVKKTLCVYLESAKDQKIKLKFPWVVRNVRSNTALIPINSSESGIQYYTLILKTNKRIEIHV